MKNSPDDLKVPDFKSDIPEHLLNGLSDKDRHIIETLSIIKQQNAWQIPAIEMLYKQAKITNGRVNKAEEKLEETEINFSSITGILKTLEIKVKSHEPVSKAWRFFNYKWVRIGLLIILIFVAFYVYPYLLTLSYRELFPLLKAFLG